MADLNTITNTAVNSSKELVNNPEILIYGIIFIIITVVIIKFLKNIIVNSIIGVAGLLILNFIFNIKLPFLLTLILSAIFGAAGLGIMLILKFFGLA